MGPKSTIEDEASWIRAARVIVVGTSGVVYPVAARPRHRGRHAGIVEVNIAATPLTRQVDAHMRGPSAERVPALEAHS